MQLGAEWKVDREADAGTWYTLPVREFNKSLIEFLSPDDVNWATLDGLLQCSPEWMLYKQRYKRDLNNATYTHTQTHQWCLRFTQFA